MKKTTKIAAVLIIALISSQASANACRDRINSRQAQIFQGLGSTCVGLDTSGKVDDQLMMRNMDGGCDSGLSLPGLPSFGFGMGGEFDWCGLAQAVTGSMVDKVNKEMQDRVDQSVGAVVNATIESTGIDPTANTNITEQLYKDAINQGKVIGDGIAQ